MPLCGATFDENSVPPWTRGDFRGVLVHKRELIWVVNREPTPALRDRCRCGEGFSPKLCTESVFQLGVRCIECYARYRTRWFFLATEA